MQSLIAAQGIDAPTALAYSTALAEQGFGTPALLKNADAEDLAACGITLRGHVKAVMNAAAAVPAPSPTLAVRAKHAADNVVAKMHATRKYLLEACVVLWSIILEVEWGDESIINTGACYAVSALMKVWGKTEDEIARIACYMAHRLSSIGAAYVYMLNFLDVPELTLVILNAFGKTDMSIAIDGCVILTNLAPGWSPEQRATLRKQGARDILSNVKETGWKEAAISSL
jgi:hypothetical protein